MAAETPLPAVTSNTLSAIATAPQIDPAPSPTETRRSRRKRSQKDASIGELSPGHNAPDAVIPTYPVEQEKKRKTTAPVATSTPAPAQALYSFDFSAQTPQNSPLVEESFQPQMATPSPGVDISPSLQLGAFDLDVTISEANTSISLDTSTQNRTATSLKDRIIAAKERGTQVNANNSTTNDPIDKYTKGNMPEVYYNHPTAALDFIDIDQVGDWEGLPDGKFLAHPFGHEVRSTDNHQEIKANLFAAVIEITQSETVGYAPPALALCCEARQLYS